MRKKPELILFCILTLIFLQGCSFTNTSVSQNAIPDFFRVGTWNVKDLFDEVDDPHKADDIGTDPARLQALADVILETDCDILAVQEVENLQILTDFNNIYLDGKYLHLVLIEGNDPRGIDVGIMSDLEIGDIKSYRNREFEEGFTGSMIKFSRDLLAVKFVDYAGNEWSLLTTHLKSGGGGENSIRRTAQASEVAEIIREDGYVDSIGRGLTILAGDLNAEPWTDDLDSLTDVPFSDPGRDNPSRATHASGKVLDYIMLSPDADRRYVVGSYVIYTEYPAHDASDHFLVYLDIYS